MLASCFTGAMMINLVRYISEAFEMHTFLIVFYRNAFALLLFLPWLARTGVHIFDLSILKTRRMKLYLWRAIAGLTAMYFWFYSLAVIPLSTATALSFTAPLFTAFLAVILLGERYGVHRWAALAAGFIGTIVVLRPGMEDFDFNALWTLVAAIFWAISSLLIKSLTSTEKPALVAFYMVLMMTPASLPMAIPYFEPLTFEILLWLIVLGLISNIFQICLTSAFASTDLVVVQPFDFTRLIFVSAIAYFVFGEVIDGYTLIGAAIIMASAVYAAYREALHERREKKLI